MKIARKFNFFLASLLLFCSLSASSASQQCTSCCDYRDYSELSKKTSFSLAALPRTLAFLENLARTHFGVQFSAQIVSDFEECSNFQAKVQKELSDLADTYVLTYLENMGDELPLTCVQAATAQNQFEVIASIFSLLKKFDVTSYHDALLTYLEDLKLKYSYNSDYWNELMLPVTRTTRSNLIINGQVQPSVPTTATYSLAGTILASFYIAPAFNVLCKAIAKIPALYAQPELEKIIEALQQTTVIDHEVLVSQVKRLHSLGLAECSNELFTVVSCGAEIQLPVNLFRFIYEASCYALSEKKDDLKSWLEQSGFMNDILHGKLAHVALARENGEASVPFYLALGCTGLSNNEIYEALLPAAQQDLLPALTVSGLEITVGLKDGETLSCNLTVPVSFAEVALGLALAEATISSRSEADVVVSVLQRLSSFLERFAHDELIGKMSGIETLVEQLRPLINQDQVLAQIVSAYEELKNNQLSSQEQREIITRLVSSFVK